MKSRWRSWKIWLPVFAIVGLASFGYEYEYEKKEVTTPAHWGAPIGGMLKRGKELQREIVPEERKKEWVAKHEYFKDKPKNDYASKGLMIGSGFGGAMSIINFFEKILAWIKRKRN